MKTRLTMLSLLACLLGVLAFTPAPATAEDGLFPFDVHQKTLDNGLRVVVIPYDSPGVVAYFSVVRTGSREEVEAGHSGFAHFFEHMMFRGTERYSNDDYNDVLKGMGADSNAFTSDDLTNYYIIGPSNALDTIMDIESDRFQNLEYSEADFKTEALSVLGEYNKNVSSPFLPMFEKLRDLAFTKHTYKHTTMGFLEDIKAMPDYYDYSLSFFDRFYRPENVIILIVGDVEPQRAFDRAKHFYGTWEKGYQPAPIPEEPPQTERKTAQIDWPSPTRPHVMMGYHSGAFDPNSRDTATLAVLSELLFSQSAPLYQELVVDKQLVDSISGGASFHRDPYLFSVTTRIGANDKIDEVQATIARHIAKIKSEPVDAARMDRIKSNLRYGFALSLDSPASVGFTAGQFLSLTGDVGAINQLYAQLQQVTPADIQRVAKGLFKPTNETVVTLLHEPKPAEDGAVEGGN